MNRILVVGAGGHGRAVAELIVLAGEYQLAGFLDDSFENQDRVWDWPVLGPVTDLASYRSRADAIVIAIGNNKVRQKLSCMAKSAEFKLATVAHPRAVISPRSVINDGCMLMAGAVIGTEAYLGTGVVVNSGAIVDHHCRVEDFGHLGTGACMAGGSVLGSGAWMQAGSALGYGVTISPNSVLRPNEAVEASDASRG